MIASPVAMMLLLGGIGSARSRAGAALRATPACFGRCPPAVRMQGLAIGSRAARSKQAPPAARAAPRAKSKKAAEAEGAGAPAPPPPAPKRSSLFVVESPSKAKTLGQYLGDSFQVLATKGHVRVLPAKKGSVLPEDEFAMTFEVPEQQRANVQSIVRAAQGATNVYLAMDPDREGEAIAWHLLRELHAAGLPLAPSARASLGDGGECDVAREATLAAPPASKPPRARRKAAAAPADADGSAPPASGDGDERSVGVWRVSFNSVSREAVLAALAAPRSLDLNLVAAQQARQSLDYLMGFTLSPVLWKRMPAARSAGRVQSVALRLIAEREGEIERFVPLRFWDVSLELAKAGGANVRGRAKARAAAAEAGGASFAARLSEVGGRRLGEHSLRSEEDAAALRALAEAAEWSVASVRSSRVRRSPKPPFNTASLQQEASSRLRMSVSRAMSVAQQLYEGVPLSDGEQVGLITYMRTDAFNISAAALADVREVVAREYGQEALPREARVHASRSKNSQEAHEAVRPVDMGRLPWSAAVRAALTAEQGRLYELIWRRTAASQMADAQYDATSVLLYGELGGAKGGAHGKAAAAAGGAGEDEGESAEGGERDGGERVEVRQLVDAGGVTNVRARASGRVLLERGFLAAYPPPDSSFADWAKAGGSTGETADADAATAEGEAEGEGDEGGGEESGGSGSAPEPLLPPLAAGDALSLLGARALGRSTRPPARFSEASLVKTLEQLGIGRPSTYAPTMRVLVARSYVEMAGRTLVPTLTGRFLSAFLCAHFGEYVERTFTAEVEAELDEISAGRLRRSELLGGFWAPLQQLAAEISAQPAAEAWAALDAELGYLAFRQDAALLGEGCVAMGGLQAAERGQGEEGAPAPSALLPRECPECGSGRLMVKHSRFGPFVGCSAHPACTYAKPFPQTSGGSGGDDGALDPTSFPRVLGEDEHGRELSVRLGPYGPYVQRSPPIQTCPPDESAQESAALAKLAVPELKLQLRACNGTQTGRKADLLERLLGLRGLPPPPEPAAEPERRRMPLSLSPANVSMELAARLFRLPRPLGEHPEVGGEMTAKLGLKAGYIEHNASYFWLEEPELAFSVTPAEAAALVSETRAAREARPSRRGRAGLVAAPRLRKPGAKPAAKSRLAPRVARAGARTSRARDAGDSDGGDGG